MLLNQLVIITFTIEPVKQLFTRISAQSSCHVLQPRITDAGQ
jgi:hypothetical protein